MRSPTMLFAIAAIALVACSNEKHASSKGSGTASASAVAKPRPAVVPPRVDEATVRPVSATVLVVVKQDGAVSIVPLPGAVDPTGIDLATLTPGTDVPIAELATKTNEQMQPPEEPTADDQGGVGTRMADPNGKMGKAPVPDTDPCGTGFDDADIYGGLLGNEVGEMSGGFGYGSAGFAPGGSGVGWGTIGTGTRRPVSAGLRGQQVMTSPYCGSFTPLIVADARTPAARLVEVMSAMPAAQIAVTTDGAHARTLAIKFWYQEGNTPFGDDLELGFTVSPDGARGSAYRGATPDAQVWSWAGAGAIGDAYHQGQARDGLLGATTVRLRIDGDLAAGALIEAIAALLAANVDGVAIGEPTAYTPPNTSGYGVSSGRRRSRDASIPSVRIGQPTVSGDLDKAIIRRYVKRSLAKITYCYEKQLLAKPGLEGTVIATWTIQPDGVVKDANAKGVDGEVASCVAAVLGNIHFPKPKGGGIVNVTAYPFELEPSGG